MPPPYRMLYIEVFNCNVPSTLLPFKFAYRISSAASEPKGPIYLWARREIMEQEVEQSLFENINTSLAKSPSVEPSALTPDGK